MIFVVQQKMDTEGWYFRKQRGAAGKVNGKAVNRSRRVTGSRGDEGLEEEVQGGGGLGRGGAGGRGVRRSHHKWSGVKGKVGSRITQRSPIFIVELCPPDGCI